MYTRVKAEAKPPLDTVIQRMIIQEFLGSSSSKKKSGKRPKVTIVNVEMKAVRRENYLSITNPKSLPIFYPRPLAILFKKMFPPTYFI